MSQENFQTLVEQAIEFMKAENDMEMATAYQGLLQEILKANQSFEDVQKECFLLLKELKVEYGMPLIDYLARN